MLEKYDPGLIAGTIGAVIGIILASIFEKGKIVHRFSKLRKILTDERDVPPDLVREVSGMVTEERDVPPWFCVIRRYRESNKMAKLISKIETAQSLLRQTFSLEQILVYHQNQISRLLETMSSEQTSRLEQNLIAHQEQISRLLETLTSDQEQKSSEQTSRLEQDLIAHQEQNLIAHQEQISRLLQNLIAHQEQTSSEQTSRLEQNLIAHQEQISSGQTSRLLQTLRNTAEEMTFRKEPMHAYLRRLRKMVLKLVMEDETSKRRAMTAMRAVRAIANVEGSDSFAVDMKENKITVIGSLETFFLAVKFCKIGIAEHLSVGPAKEETKTRQERRCYKGGKEGGASNSYVCESK